MRSPGVRRVVNRHTAWQGWWGSTRSLGDPFASPGRPRAHRHPALARGVELGCPAMQSGATHTLKGRAADHWWDGGMAPHWCLGRPNVPCRGSLPAATTSVVEYPTLTQHSHSGTSRFPPAAGCRRRRREN
jgi:hypothetical protein